VQVGSIALGADTEVLSRFPDTPGEVARSIPADRQTALAGRPVALQSPGAFASPCHQRFRPEFRNFVFALIANTALRLVSGLRERFKRRSVESGTFCPRLAPAVFRILPLFRFEIRIGLRLRAITVLLSRLVASRGPLLRPSCLALRAGGALLLVRGPLLRLRRAGLLPLRPATHRRRLLRPRQPLRAIRLRCGKVRPAFEIRAALRFDFPLRRMDRYAR
jgi:hypothetical protein